MMRLLLSLCFVATLVFARKSGHAEKEPCPPVDRACTYVYRPVCASDGKTYGSECARSRYPCLTTVHDGECQTTTPRPQRSCTGDTVVCANNYRPVCGSDSKTYSNKCALFAAHCEAQKRGQSVSKVSVGECKLTATQPATARRTTSGAETSRPQRSCSEASSRDTTVCTEDYRPVCGSDGKTYPNRCALFAAHCEAQRRGQSISKVSKGECKLATTRAVTSGRTTPPPTTPRPAKSRPQRSCPDPSSRDTIVCTGDYKPVCGSDNKTYSNKCALFAANCEAERRGQSVSKASDGEC